MFQVISNRRFRALIDPDRGANCLQLRDLEQGITVLREPENITAPDSPYLYGMPILFPVNRIADGKFDFDGRVYRFPVNEEGTNCHCHGTLCQSKFRIVNQTPSEILCRYFAEEGELYPGFPHAFEVTVYYRLTENGMRQSTTLTNYSSQRMPVMLGFHTTFPMPFMPGQKVEDIRIQADLGIELERDPVRHLPTGRLLPEDDITVQLRAGIFSPAAQDISRHYIAGKPGVMRLIDRKHRLEIRYENSWEMPYRLLLSNAKQGYICMEPQSCMVNCGNGPFGQEESGFSFLEPKASRTYTSRISVIHL